MSVSLNGACPFQGAEGRCMGALTFFDKEQTIAVCPDGHQSSPAHAIGAPGQKTTPVKFRHRRINPKDAALLTTLSLLVINAVVEKL